MRLPILLKRLLIAVAVVVAVSALALFAFYRHLMAAAGPPVATPGDVQIVTSDIPNFWNAFDAASRGNAPAAYALRYFAPGSPGVWGFVPDRLESPWHLASVVDHHRAYYEAIRPYTYQIVREVPEIRAGIARFKRLYPPAVFQNVYFVVGALNSGGTSVPGIGVVLGAEFISKPPGYHDAVKDVPLRLLHNADAAPLLVAHEFAHFNQHDAKTNKLLDGSLVEGTADFFSQFAIGSVSSHDQWTFGCAHEDGLWTLFRSEMDSHNDKVTESWLYDYSGSPMHSPPFMGYWIGSRIAQTYYFHAPNKEQALHDILNIKEYSAFLKASGYPQRRPPCKAEF